MTKTPLFFLGIGSDDSTSKGSPYSRGGFPWLRDIVTFGRVADPASDIAGTDPLSDPIDFFDLAVGILGGVLGKPKPSAPMLQFGCEIVLTPAEPCNFWAGQLRYE